MYDRAGGGSKTRIGSAIFEEIMVITNPVEVDKVKPVSTLDVFRRLTGPEFLQMKMVPRFTALRLEDSRCIS